MSLEITPLISKADYLSVTSVSKSLSVSRRTVDRWRAKGFFPPPDLRLGPRNLWARETIRVWLDRHIA